MKITTVSILEKEEPLARTPRAHRTGALNSPAFDEIFGLLIGGDLRTTEIFGDAYLHCNLVQCRNVDASTTSIKFHTYSTGHFSRAFA